MNNFVVSSVAFESTPSPQAAWSPGLYIDKESGVFGVERLPVGIILQGWSSVEFLVSTVREPGATTLQIGRRRVRPVTMTIVQAKERA